MASSPDLDGPQPQIVPKSYDADVNYIERERKVVDYEIIAKGARVVAIGEMHSFSSHETEAIVALRELSKQGFTHLGIEMIDISMQPTVDRYIETGEGREQLLQYLSDHWDWEPDSSNRYMEIVDEARRLGMKVLGIGWQEDEEQSAFAEKEITRHENEVDHKRNIMMAKAVLDILSADPSLRIVTYTGASHSSNYMSKMGGILKESGIGVSTVRFTFGIPDIDKAIFNAGLSQERFMFPQAVRVPNYQPLQHDWIINLPRI